MYRLLIVDDEAEIIDGLKTIIDWESYGITLCGSADNGATAFEYMKELSPDIVIMDIRMPVLDGIGLLKKIAENAIPVKSIILSGYDDFNYAQKAMDLNATGYLLKPCRPKDILDAVLKVKALLDDERQKESLLHSYKQQFLENQPILREKFLREVLYGKTGDFIKAKSKIHLYDIGLPFEHLQTVLLRIDNMDALYETHGGLDVEALKIAAAELSRKAFTDVYHHEVFQNGDDIVILLSFSQQPERGDTIVRCLDTLRSQVQESLGITATLGVGNPVVGIESLWLSYKEAVSAAEAKFFLGDNRVIVFSDITLASEQPGSYPRSEEIAIINCLNTGNTAHMAEKVDSFYKSLQSRGSQSKQYLQRATFALLGRIYQFCMDNHIDTTDIMGEELKLFESVQKCETHMALQEKINLILSTILGKAAEREKTGKLIKSAIDYIFRYYAEDISLDAVAKHVFISPGYLSQLFKLEVGINFLDFLNQYRIQKSKELLEKTFLKNYEIAQLVGFNDEKYYSQVFKRYIGLTPSQYRESCKN